MWFLPTFLKTLFVNPPICLCCSRRRGFPTPAKFTMNSKRPNNDTWTLGLKRRSYQVYSHSSARLLTACLILWPWLPSLPQALSPPVAPSLLPPAPQHWTPWILSAPPSTGRNSVGESLWWLADTRPIIYKCLCVFSPSLPSSRYFHDWQLAQGRALWAVNSWLPVCNQAG